MKDASYMVMFFRALPRIQEEKKHPVYSTIFSLLLYVIRFFFSSWKRDFSHFVERISIRLGSGVQLFFAGVSKDGFSVTS